MDYNLLSQQNAATSAAIITHLSKNKTFHSLSIAEAKSIVQRDTEDAAKLQAGVELSIQAGQLSTQTKPPTYKSIDVIGKSPNDVCDIILNDMGDAVVNGGVVVLCGLSGTGKGTTVRTLGERLPEGKSTAWSNGNVFRSLTLLAATWCEQNQQLLDQALTPKNLNAFMKMLHFGLYEHGWDIQIKGLGISAFVSKIKNTELKSNKVKNFIPTVARVTQGTVVVFAAAAAQKMADAGLIVLLEGREATVNYIPSNYRYTLTMSDNVQLGQRRAAQRIAASAFERMQRHVDVDLNQPKDISGIESALDYALLDLSLEKSAKRILTHMNNDHSLSLLAYAHMWYSIEATSATLTGITPNAFVMRVTRQTTEMKDGKEIVVQTVVKGIEIQYTTKCTAAKDMHKIAVNMHFEAFNGLGMVYKLKSGYYQDALTHIPKKVWVGGLVIVVAISVGIKYIFIKGKDKSKIE
jgi:cytidylate kinase